jgi:hypothetical protein
VRAPAFFELKLRWLRETVSTWERFWDIPRHLFQKSLDAFALDEVVMRKPPRKG